jgi:hypothetical protein
MNQAAHRPRIRPWLVIALAAVLALLAAGALVLVVESGFLQTIGAVLQGPQPMAPVGGCGGSAVSACQETVRTTLPALCSVSTYRAASTTCSRG